MLVLTLLSFTDTAAVGPAGHLGHHRWVQHGRATPFLGHRPGRGAAGLGDVPLIHAYDDARFALLGGSLSAKARCCGSTCCTVGLPLGIAVLMAVHFWRVRKDGGISGPL